MAAAGDQIKQLAKGSRGLPPNGTVVVTVPFDFESLSSSCWDGLALTAAAQFERFEEADVSAVEFWRSEECRIGFVTRDAFEEKVKPAMGETGTRGPNELSLGSVKGIGPIKRICAYTETRNFRRVQCGFEMLFSERPNHLPTCGNNSAPATQRKSLDEHDFQW